MRQEDGILDIIMYLFLLNLSLGDLTHIFHLI